MKLLVTSDQYVGKITTVPRLFVERLLKNENEHQINYECTHQMELFDTHFVWFGQALGVSGMKLLVTSNQYIQVVKSQPYLDSFCNTYSKIKTNIRL